MRVLYRNKRLLGFEPYVAPTGFDRHAQPVDIYDVFERYYRNHRTAKWIYSVTDAATTTAPTGGTSYHYGYELAGVKYTADLSIGGTITWAGGSTKRWVIVNHTTMSMMTASISHDKFVEWMYCGNYISSVSTSGTGGFASSSSIKYIHIHKLENITTYGYCCHYGNSYLTGNLYLSSSATIIGESQTDGLCFDRCTNITGNLVIPDSVVTIAFGSFRMGGSNWTSLTLGSSLEYIGDYAFYGETGFTSLTIPDKVKYIGKYAFYGCTAFSGQLTIPSSVEQINTAAFANTNFSPLVSNSSTIIIDDHVLYDIYTAGEVKAIHSEKSYNGTITLRNDTTLIGEYCFYANARTGDLEIPNTVTTISEGAFASCNGLTGSLTFEATSVLSTLGSMAFWYPRFTGALELPDSLKVIPFRAFSNGNGFTSIDLGSAENINADAFGGSPFAGTLHIPSTVTTMGLGCFGTNTNFNTITSDSTNYPASDNVLYDVKTAGSVIAHLSAKAYSGTLTLRSDTTRIYSSCFNSNSNRTGSLSLPDTVKTIDGGAFISCTGFDDMSMLYPGSDTTTIGSLAFWGTGNKSGFVWNFYPLTAPTITGTPFGNFAKPLHIQSGTTGYDVAPWTNTAIFATITADL